MPVRQQRGCFSPIAFHRRKVVSRNSDAALRGRPYLAVCAERGLSFKRDARKSTCAVVNGYIGGRGAWRAGAAAAALGGPTIAEP